MVDPAAGDPADVRLRPLPRDRYREFAHLGSGSMGVVYLALDTEMNRRVAFKMIRPEEDPGQEPLDATPTPDDEAFDELQARFLQEAWVTGGLEHPGIVPVYELGRTTGGIPYYTMRRVRGERTLADAIDAAQGLDARLALLEPFLRVCDTVRYAHARGVIHRDLKPANIALGDFGETVVLDWGLAKLKDQPDLTRSVWRERVAEFRDATDLHTLASAIGTPGYMSPEAALAQIEEVDARTDVYSLGAILYRILTGRLPVEFRSYGELLEKLAAGAPEDPVARDPAIPAGLARICMRALASRKDDRYADADEMAGAIRAWQTESAVDREIAALTRQAEAALQAAPTLEGEAALRQVDRVTAVCARILDLRPGHEQAETLQRRGRELRERAIAERERGARRRLMKRVAVVGLAVATAATVLVAVLLDARRREAEDARARETVARTRAEEERARAEDLADFMLYDLRAGLAPIGRLDLLGAVARKSLAYHESLPEKTASSDRAVAVTNVGDVLVATGDLTHAERCFREALAINRRLASGPAATPAHRRGLSVAVSRVGDVLRKQGELEGALASYQECLDLRRQLLAEEPANLERRRDVEFALNRVARIAADRGETEAALAGLRESLAIARRLVEEDPGSVEWNHDLITTLNQLNEVQFQQKDVDGVVRSSTEALEILTRMVTEHPEHVFFLQELDGCLQRLGMAEEMRGDLPAALRRHREALEIGRRLVKQDPTNAQWQHDLALELDKVGNIELAQGNVAAALESFREFLRIIRPLVQRDPTNVDWQTTHAWSLRRLGTIERARGNIDAALQHYQDAAAILERLIEQGAADAACRREAAHLHGMIASVHAHKGNAEAALENYGAAREMLVHLAEQAPSDANLQDDLAVTCGGMALVEYRQRNLKAALRHLEEATAIHRQLVQRQPSVPDWQLKLSVDLDTLGAVQNGLGDAAAALRSYREAAEIGARLAALDPTNVRWQREYSMRLYNVGWVLLGQGDPQQALGFLRDAERAHSRAVKLAPQLQKEHGDWEGLRRHAALLAGERQPESSGDHLALAHAHYDGREYARSARRFEKALEDDRIRADVDRGNLYNAACAAALAGAGGEGEEARAWRDRALAWLKEDLRRRRESGQDEAALRAHVDHARVKDPDLASLRGTPEFEALFRKP